MGLIVRASQTAPGTTQGAECLDLHRCRVTWVTARAEKYNRQLQKVKPLQARDYLLATTEQRAVIAYSLPLAYNVFLNI